MAEVQNDLRNEDSGQVSLDVFVNLSPSPCFGFA